MFLLFCVIIVGISTFGTNTYFLLRIFYFFTFNSFISYVQQLKVMRSKLLFLNSFSGGITAIKKFKLYQRTYPKHISPGLCQHLTEIIKFLNIRNNYLHNSNIFIPNYQLVQGSFVYEYNCFYLGKIVIVVISIASKTEFYIQLLLNFNVLVI